MSEKENILGKIICTPVSYQQDKIHSTSFSTAWQASASRWKIQLLFFLHVVLIKLKTGYQVGYHDNDIRFEEVQVLLSMQDYSLDENQA